MRLYFGMVEELKDLRLETRESNDVFLFLFFKMKLKKN